LPFHCRLGTILLERGQFMEAADMVASSAQRFAEVLKADNPVRGEAAFALALARMFQLMPFQVTPTWLLLLTKADAGRWGCYHRHSRRCVHPSMQLAKALT
jgi:hypothetical protein